MKIVRSKRTIILTDNAGNKLILKDIVYIPENSNQILSLMKLRREHQIDFHFIAIEKFIISLPNDISFIGKSVNDICHIWTSSLQINVVNTHNASKKRKYDNNDNDQSSSSNVIASTSSSSNSPSIQPLQYNS